MPPLAALAALGFAAAAHAAPADPDRKRDTHDQVVLFGVGIFPLGLNLGYKQLVHELVSTQALVGFGQSDLTLFGEDLFRYRRARLQLGADLHPQRTGLRGWYVGPRLQVLQYTFGPHGQTFTDADSVSTTAWSGSLMGGYRWVADRGFTYALGAGYTYTQTRVTGDAIDEYLNSGVVSAGGGVSLEMSFGWAF